MDLLEPPADGSLPLKNDRHEKFCQLYSGSCFGNTAAAYKQAGYSPRTSAAATSEAWRLFRNDDIARRVAFLRAEAMKQLPIDRARILELRLLCMNDKTASWTDRLRAASDIEKSLGLTEAVKVDVKGLVTTIVFEGMDGNAEQQ